MSDAQHPLPLALTPEARRRLFESVVVHADDAILVTEAEPVELPGPRIVYVNDAFTRMTGYRLEEVFGQTPRVLQTLETNRAELDRLRAALKAWRPVRVELLNRRKDGREFWVELNINPVADETGWLPTGCPSSTTSPSASEPRPTCATARSNCAP